MTKYYLTMLFFSCVVFYPQRGYTQDPEAYDQSRVYFLNSDDYVIDIDNLKQNFGTNKNYPKEMELACLTALSFYPELKNTKINFIRRDIGYMMNAQPSFRFINLFKNRKKKTYNIKMSTNQDMTVNAVVDSLNFNSLVGILAHELAHIIQYTEMSLSKFAFTYMNSKGHKQIESGADNIVINRGLGYALYEQRYFSIYLSGRAEEKNVKVIKYYLQPEEILERTKNFFKKYIRYLYKDNTMIYSYNERWLCVPI